MKQLLPFKVGYETYALELTEIQEIVEQQQIHEFPGSPAVVAGAIGFHGRIVPVIDLAKLLDFPTGRIGSRLIVLINERGPVALGVDLVGSIVTLDISRANRIQNYAERQYIRDIVNWGGGMMSLIDLDQLQAELELLCDNAGG
ncbi:MAG: chemotaxis protein CheW [Deltaproteobacteria bacterium]|jgi:purine-binding chemotaxis protein CheW|nr:chemotaxis protein CheW [Deltaproteobacteria bacterium]MCW9048922.1 chemotaxis protein CheW [Deltaproteobacteria bacterium]